MKKFDYRSLKFGVEIEFTGLSRKNSSTIIASYFKTDVVIHTGGEFDTYKIKEGSRIWQIVRDQSIKAYKLTPEGKRVPADSTYRCELVTPVLSFNTKDILILQDLVRILKEHGAITNASTAIHIHVGAEEFDSQHLRILCNMIFSKQELISKALRIEPKRKKYCKPLEEKFIQELNKRKPNSMQAFGVIWFDGPDTWSNNWSFRYHQSRYRILNLRNLLGDRQQTVEFRAFNGTLDGTVILAYIQFCLLVTAQALNQDRASAKETKSKSENDRYSFRVWLLKIGAIGEEFIVMRHVFLRNLKGNSAWRGSPKEGSDERFAEMLKLFQPLDFPPAVLDNSPIWPDEDASNAEVPVIEEDPERNFEWDTDFESLAGRPFNFDDDDNEE